MAQYVYIVFEPFDTVEEQGGDILEVFENKYKAIEYCKKRGYTKQVDETCRTVMAKNTEVRHHRDFNLRTCQMEERAIIVYHDCLVITRYEVQ